MNDGTPCPEVSQHAVCPTGLVEWHDWAKRKGKTHTQKRCPGCGLWKVWVPKKPRKRKERAA